jgi:hypothetical protein
MASCLSVALLLSACSFSEPEKPAMTVTPMTVPVAPMASKAEQVQMPVNDATVKKAKSIAKQRQEAQGLIDSQDFHGALRIHGELFIAGYITDAEFELTFSAALASMDRNGISPGLPLEWLVRGEVKLRPFALRYYEQSVEVLKHTGMADLKRRQTLDLADCLYEDGEVLLVMAELAERLGKTLDARTWRIYHADHLSTGSGPQCKGKGRSRYAYMEMAYQEYVDLGLTQDARRTAETVIAAYTRVLDWDKHCGESWPDSVSVWFDRAGWSREKIDRHQLKERTKHCKASR